MNKAWESQNETEIWSMRGPVKLHGMAPVCNGIPNLAVEYITDKH
jgi:hypothetical protein